MNLHGAPGTRRCNRGSRRLDLPIGEPPLRVSAIVPVLNEAARMNGVLHHLFKVPDLHEVIVVDGGSNDRTVELAAAHPGVILLRAPRGRARQMNAGAEAATGDVLLFVHADVMVPLDAAAWVRRALTDPATVAGAFRTWTVADADEAPFWASFLHLADLRSRYTSLPYGDQAPFVRADTLRQLGGFADLELMEDLELSRRLRRVGRVVTVPATVVVSGRRFLARPIFYAFVVNVLPLLYRVGVRPETLSRWYRHVR